MNSVTVRRPPHPIRAAIELPRSKSISNRALICASLAGDPSCIHDLSDADDTRILHHLLTQRRGVMHCGLGGTTFRFLLAWAAVQDGAEHVITGASRLLERPHEDLLNALRSIGADIERTNEGYRVRGRKLNGGEVVLDGPLSSQFISALMMIAPMMGEGLRIAWMGRRLSEPYVRMTARVMQHFGAMVEVGETLIDVKPGRYTVLPFDVPYDWSAAAFWYEIVALADDAELELVGLKANGWQGDEAIVRLMDPFVAKEGAVLRKRFEPLLKSLRVDLSTTPDLFQPMVFALAHQDVRWAFTGLYNLAVKETDRLTAVENVLRSLGIAVVRSQDGLSLSGDAPPAPMKDHIFGTHGDHRMAMALAPLALVYGRTTILDPDVVNKSYPRYWDDLERAGFLLERS